MFRVRPCPLQVNSLLDAALPEQLMAAPHSLLEAQTFKQLAQVIKTDGRVRRTAEKASKRFLSAHSDHSTRCRVRVRAPDINLDSYLPGDAANKPRSAIAFFNIAAAAGKSFFEFAKKTPPANISGVQPVLVFASSLAPWSTRYCTIDS